MATPGINTKVKMEGEKEYRAALALINAELKRLGAEMRNSEQDFVDNADSVDSLAKKSEILGKSLLEQQDKVDVLRKAVATATETYKESDTRLVNWKTSLLNAETELKKMQRSLDDNNAALEDARAATEHLSSGLDELEQQTDSTADKISDSADDLNNLGQKAGDAQRETMGLGSTVDQLTNKLGFSLPEGLKKTMDGISDVDLKTAALVGSFAGVATAIVGVEKKLASLTTEAGASAKELLVLSEVTGQSTDELQEFDYMSKFLGVSTDQLSDGLKEITNKMQEARDGSADAADAFDRLGVRVTDSRGELRDAGEVFYEVIDALGDMKNQTERDATAMDLLSESARNFNPLINRGSEVLKAYAEEAHNTGYVLSDETLKALTQVDDAYQHMLLSQEASKNQLAEEFAPYLAEFYQNLESIITDLAAAATDSGIIDLFGSLLKLASALSPVLSGLADAASALKPIFETLAGAISAVADAISTVNQLSSNFGSGLSGVVGSLGIGGGSITGLVGGLSSAGSLRDMALTELKRRGYATGTDNFIGGVTWVGENGPELVSLPQGTRIFNEQESRQVVGGDTYNFYVQANEIQEIDDFIRRMKNQRRLARMGVA